MIEKDFNFAYHVSTNSSLKPLGISFSAKQRFQKSSRNLYLMDLSLSQVSLSAVFSFCIFKDDMNPETGVPITSFSPMSVLVKVCSTSIVDVSYSRSL